MINKFILYIINTFYLQFFCCKTARLCVAFIFMIFCCRRLRLNVFISFLKLWKNPFKMFKFTHSIAWKLDFVEQTFRFFHDQKFSKMYAYIFQILFYTCFCLFRFNNQSKKFLIILFSSNLSIIKLKLLAIETFSNPNLKIFDENWIWNDENTNNDNETIYKTKKNCKKKKLNENIKNTEKNWKLKNCCCCIYIIQTWFHIFWWFCCFLILSFHCFIIFIFICCLIIFMNDWIMNWNFCFKIKLLKHL